MVKIDIISGFLGAGKTTLIKKFIGEALQGEKLVLIENEFGEIGVDGGFLQDAGIEIKEMNSGCICCSLVGDFATALKEVIDTYAPERIIIEPSGVGKLSDVEKAILDIDTDVDICMNNKIVVVNALKCAMHIKNFGEFFINQVHHADAIVLSRTAGMDEKKLAIAIEMIREHNEKATILTTDWAVLNGADMLEGIEEQHKMMEELLHELHEHDHEHHHDHEEGCCCGGHHNHEHHHEHHDHDHEEGCCCGGHHDHKHHHEHHDHDHEEGCCCGGHHDHEHHHEHHDHDHEESCCCGGHHDHEHHHHHADEVFKSWGVETACKYAYAKIHDMLDDLENESKYGFVLRAKGMLECEEGKWVYFDYTPGEVEVRFGSPCTTGKICVIGSKIKEEALKMLFMQ